MKIQKTVQNTMLSLYLKEKQIKLSIYKICLDSFESCNMLAAKQYTNVF